MSEVPEAQSPEALNWSIVQVNTYLGHIIRSKVTKLNGQAIKKSYYTAFKGANLSITWFDKVCYYNIMVNA